MTPAQGPVTLSVWPSVVCSPVFVNQWQYLSISPQLFGSVVTGHIHPLTLYSIHLPLYKGSPFKLLANQTKKSHVYEEPPTLPRNYDSMFVQICQIQGILFSKWKNKQLELHILGCIGPKWVSQKAKSEATKTDMLHSKCECPTV